MAVQAHLHEIGRPERSRRFQPPLLRHVTDQVAAPLSRASANGDGAMGERLQAEHSPQQGGLAGPVRAQYREELASRTSRSSPDHKVRFARVSDAERTASTGSDVVVMGEALGQRRRHWRSSSSDSPGRAGASP